MPIGIYKNKNGLHQEPVIQTLPRFIMAVCFYGSPLKREQVYKRLRFCLFSIESSGEEKGADYLRVPDRRLLARYLAFGIGLPGP